jgi:hypothetical protein
VVEAGHLAYKDGNANDVGRKGEERKRMKTSGGGVMY